MKNIASSPTSQSQKINSFSFMGSLASQNNPSFHQGNSSQHSNSMFGSNGSLKSQQPITLRRSESTSTFLPSSDSLSANGDPIEELAQSFRVQENRIKELENELKEEKSVHLNTQKALAEANRQVVEKESLLKSSCEDAMKISKNLSEMTSEMKDLQNEVKDLNEVRTQLMKQNGDLRLIIQEQKKKFVKLMKEANERINLYKKIQYGLTTQGELGDATNDKSMDLEAQFDPTNISNNSISSSSSTSTASLPSDVIQDSLNQSSASIDDSAMDISKSDTALKDDQSQVSGNQSLVQQFELLHYYLDQMHEVMESCSNCAPKLAKIFEVNDTTSNDQMTETTNTT